MERVLQMDDTRFEDVQRMVDYLVSSVKSGVAQVATRNRYAAGCPLHAVKTSDGSNAFREFVRFVIGVAKELHVSKYSKKESSPSSGQVFEMGYEPETK
jgi:hypothetical protein